MVKKRNPLELLIILSLALTSCLKTVNDPVPGKVINHPTLSIGHKICIIGDSGKGTSKQLLVAEFLNKEGCDSVRHTGDIVYNDGIESSEDKAFFERFYNPYQPLIESGVPFFMSMGNHDYKLKPEAWFDVAKKYKNIHFPSMYYMDIFEGLCFITLDTNYRQNKQLKWMETLKQKYQSQCKATLVFAHHPLYSSGKHGGAYKTNRNFLRAAIQGKVDAYFAGHDHNQADEGEHDGTRFFVSGGAGEYRFIKSKPGVWAEAKLGYMTLTLKRYTPNPSFKFEFYSIDEKEKTKLIKHSGTFTTKGFR